MVKEDKKRNIIEIILYIILIIMGIIVMSFPAFGLINPIYYLGALFYIYAFFTVIAYFTSRKEEEYELLFNSLIDIIVASFLIAVPNENAPFMLGTAMLIYTLLVIVNRGFIVYKYKKNENYLWIIKFIITFLIAFLGILTIINLYNELSVQTLIIGYYFITLGVMLVIEPLFKLFISPQKFNKIVAKILEEDGKSESKKQITIKNNTPNKAKRIVKTKDIVKRKSSGRKKTKSTKWVLFYIIFTISYIYLVGGKKWM